MKFIPHSWNFLKRIILGKEIVTIEQTPEQWDRQFKEGRWSGLTSHQPNTAFIGGLILDRTSSSEATRTILDVGCGNGALAKIVSSHSNVRYVGTDVSKNALEHAIEHAPSATFIHLDAQTPPDEITRANMVIFNEIFFYVKPSTTLPRYASMCKPGTEVVVSVVRSWRSWFLWPMITAHIAPSQQITIFSKERSLKWDICVGIFK